MKHVSEHPWMSQRLFTKNVTDNTACLHFKIFPAHISAAEESAAPIRFGPFALGTSTSLRGYPFLYFCELLNKH